MTRLLFALVVVSGMLSGCVGEGALDQRFDAAERAVIAAETQETLEHNKTGQSRNWQNPATGRRGTVLPMRTFERSGFPCREFQQTVTIAGRTLIAYDVACRRDDGTWKSDDYASLVGAIENARPFQDRRSYDPRYYPYRRHLHSRIAYDDWPPTSPLRRIFDYDYD